MKNDNFNYRIDEKITAPELRLIGEDGRQIGVVKRQEALDKARQAGLNLIEIAPKAKPPVAKIADIGKFKYQEEKKLQKQKKGSKAPDLKEIRFSPFIAPHDFRTRLERIKEFLDEGNKVRAVVVFRGREMNSKSFGYDILKKVVSNFEGAIVVDSEPKFIGRHLQITISPYKKGVQKNEGEEIKNA